MSQNSGRVSTDNNQRDCFRQTSLQGKHKLEPSHKEMSQVSEQARERSEKGRGMQRNGALQSKWAVQVNKRSGSFKTQLTADRNKPSETHYWSLISTAT